MIHDSELIINPDGSIYHLNIRPEQLAPTIITVGDPERVAEVSKHFDRIDTQVRKREFDRIRHCQRRTGSGFKKATS